MPRPRPRTCPHMLTLFRWLLRLTIALIVLAVLSAVLVWYFAVRSLPD